MGTPKRPTLKHRTDLWSECVIFQRVIEETRTYETSESCDRVHLGHLKKKKLKKNFFEKK